jgi:hypothetical protein
MRLEEVNQLPHHRRLMLEVLGVGPLEDVDRSGLELEENQDLELGTKLTQLEVKGWRRV